MKEIEVGRTKDGKPILVRKGKGGIAKENKTEWRWEKRAKELSKRGYSVGAIEAMMDSGSGKFPARRLEKMIKHIVKEKDMRLDGKL